MEALVPIPETGRTFRVAYTVRLSDTDATGRLRLDAIARYLQDAAIDDVQETGWGAPEHLWVLRSVRIDALVPSLEDNEVGIVTWGSSFSALAAGRRWSLSGDMGGSIEVDSTWIHLGADARPARIGTVSTATPRPPRAGSPPRSSRSRRRRSASCGAGRSASPTSTGWAM